MIRQGARAIVLDLRANSGGRLDVGVHALASFLPAGIPALQQWDRDGRRQVRLVPSGHDQVDLPVVALVDERSESMAELFSAALQEYSVATVIGQTTSGNVAGGQLFELGGDAALDVTMFDLASAHGAALDGRGVTPDVRVDGTRATDVDGEDPPLRVALDRLRQSDPSAMEARSDFRRMQTGPAPVITLLTARRY